MFRAEITKRRGAFVLNAAIEMPEACRVLGIVGPSGGGKTTLLDCIAGVDRPDAGHVQIHGDVWFDADAGTIKSLRNRRVGYVFQDGALFDHLSVRENLAYGMRGGVDKARVEGMALDLGIAALLDRSPKTASGGERRRIAIGRALLSDPQLLLLDEPLTGLDTVTAGRVLVYLRRLLMQTGVPALFVSHSPSDLMHICDRVVGIANGQVVHSGDATSVLSVADCTGARELSELRSIIEARHVSTEDSARSDTFEAANGVKIVALGRTASLDLTRSCAISIFARDVVLASHRPRGVSARNVYAGRVHRIERTESLAVVEVDIGIRLFSEVGYESLREMSLVEGADVFAFFKASAVQRLL